MRRRNALAVAAAAAVVGAVVRGAEVSSIRDAAAVSALYDRLAPVYDLLVSPYEWLGGRRLQAEAIAALDLRPGDTVVDLGTGTGWNLPILAAAVGETGAVIGVDLSPRMLDRARARVDRYGVGDVVRLEVADLRDYRPAADTAAVTASFAMEMVPDHDEVIGRLAEQLFPGSRITLVGMRDPEGWPEWLVRLGALLNRPFGVNPAYREIRPWTTIQRHLAEVEYREAMSGAVYAATGRVVDGAKASQ